MSSKPLLAAAILSAATTVVATAVSERNPQLPDEPLGPAGRAATDPLVGTLRGAGVGGEIPVEP